MTDENPITHPLVPDPAPDAEGPVRVEASPSGVVVVTLDRAEARNRMTPALQGALREAFETLHGADHVRLVLIRGAGGHFCAGYDPEWMRLSFDWTEADLRDDALDQGRMLKALHEIPALTVALVEGEAYGPGVGLVAACDMALATETARFGFPELKFGLLPSVSAPYLADAIGPRHAQALLGIGPDRSTRGEAQRIGLVQAVAAGRAGARGPGRAAHRRRPGLRARSRRRGQAARLARLGPSDRSRPARGDRPPLRRPPGQPRRDGGRAGFPGRTHAELESLSAMHLGGRWDGTRARDRGRRLGRRLVAVEGAAHARAGDAVPQLRDRAAGAVLP